MRSDHLRSVEKITSSQDHIRQQKWLPECTPLWPVAKKNNINEFAWLKDVFERIQSHKQKDLYQLLPSNWEKHKTNPNP